MRNSLTSCCVGFVFACSIASSAPPEDGGELLDQTPSEEEVTASTLAESFRSRINGLDQLDVNARYTVAYTSREYGPDEQIEKDVSAAISDDGSETVIVSATVKSSMTEDSFSSRFWKEGVSREGNEPITTLALSDVDGEKTYRLEHYYPALDVVRKDSMTLHEVREKSGGPHFVDLTLLPNPLFAEIPGVCSTTEFWYTWIGGYANNFARIISRGQLEEDLVTYGGRDAHKITRVVYDREADDGYRSRHDTFYIDRKTDNLIGWEKDFIYTKDDVLLDGTSSPGHTSASYKRVRVEYKHLTEPTSAQARKP